MTTSYSLNSRLPSGLSASQATVIPCIASAGVVPPRILAGCAAVIGVLALSSCDSKTSVAFGVDAGTVAFGVDAGTKVGTKSPDAGRGGGTEVQVPEEPLYADQCEVLVPAAGASDGWTNVSQSTAASSLRVEFVARAGATGLDGVIAISDGPVDAFAEAQMLVRFNDEGDIDVRNGFIYASDVSYPYEPGTWYNFAVEADLGSRRYDVRVGECGAALTQLIEAAEFRSDASVVSAVNNLALWSSQAATVEVAEVRWAGEAGCDSEPCEQTVSVAPDDDPDPEPVMVTAPPTEAGMVAEVTQYGITWAFEEEALAGKYISGDWWVVGPVTLTSVTPEPTGVANGTMLNPLGGSQAYDARGSQYDGSAQLSDFPARLTPGTSVVSATSKGGGSDGQEFKNVGVLQTQAVLTVVDEAPGEGEFRPAYAGTYKKSFNIDDIRWNALPRLDPITSSTPVATILKWFSMPRIDHLTTWGIQYSCAQDNWGDCYGRELSDQVAEAALYVLMDTEAREAIALGLIQRGIDNYGVLKAGGGFPLGQNNPGGHFSGRKFPIVFAAVMLDDAELRGFDTEFSNELYFQEDLQTYFGPTGEALWGSPCTAEYTATCSGSGAKDCRDPNGIQDGCNDYRVCCTSSTWVGQALAVMLMGAEEVWNHDPFFAYVERWVAETADNEELNAWGGSKYGEGKFRRDTWNAYRSSVGN